jgi:hypothetical protein
VAAIIERIDLGCASNLLRVLICLTASLQALTRDNDLKAINADESDDGSAIFTVHLNAGQRVLRLTRRHELGRTVKADIGHLTEEL